MGLINLLSDTVISVYGGTYDVALNWIGNLIRILISAVGSVGVGIILFSIILKVIVLPFDVYQRITMRKQNQKMKENQAKMEKLQKQYANDKAKYNEKLMEMYKENGISMFSSCLPMILSLVIFIVAINAFNAFAQYSNIENYNTMVRAYKGQYEYYCADLGTQENSNITISDGVITVRDQAGEDKFIYYTLPVSTDVTLDTFEAQKTYIENASYTVKSYYVDNAKALLNEEVLAFVNAFKQANAEKTDGDALQAFFEDKAQNAVVVAYDKEVKNNSSFLWIKNIWTTDASYKHPVLNYTDFKAEISRENFEVNGEEVSIDNITKFTNVYGGPQYDKITAKLTEQKTQANGYFILIVLSIGTILLQQWISMRSQKEQQKFSSVDGQGASQQKMMMIMMTAMFAIFSFMYSSAFSIYMIMSNVLSLLSLLIINKLVDKNMEKKEEEAFKERYSRRFARTPNADGKDKKNKK